MKFLCCKTIRYFDCDYDFDYDYNYLLLQKKKKTWMKTVNCANAESWRTQKTHFVPCPWGTTACLYFPNKWQKKTSFTIEW